MLTTTPRRSAEKSVPEEQRVCVICDGLDSVMLLASYVAQFPLTGTRTDLFFGDALDGLRASEDGAFTQVLIAPHAQKNATSQLTQAIVDMASRKTAEVILLLPTGGQLAVTPCDNLTVAQGPPFVVTRRPGNATSPDDSGTSGEATEGGSAAWQMLQRLIGKKRPRVEVPAAPPRPARIDRRVIAVQPLVGGAGATTFAVNAAIELAQAKPDLSICLFDLNLQFGNVATYLNLPQSPYILEALRDVTALDQEAFGQCLAQPMAGLSVFAAPEEIVPIDAIDKSDLAHLLGLARATADLVIIDLPHLVSELSGLVFAEADLVLALSTLDVRAAQNVAKLRRLCHSEGLAQGKMEFVVNRAPRKRDRFWRRSLYEFESALPGPLLGVISDGGAEVLQACNAGEPLRKHAQSNDARSDIRKLCDALRPTLGRRAKLAAKLAEE